MVYVEIEVGEHTNLIFMKSTDRDLKPHFLKFKAGIQTTIL